jgi:anti-sigma factor RsiW
MNTERQLMRLLHGELDAERARELEARLEREVELRARYRRLAGAWRGLEPPPAAPVPGGFSARVMAAARGARSGELSWSLAPAWARAGSVAALLAGLLLGASFGLWSPGVRPPGVRPPGAAATGTGLAEAGEQEAYALAEPLSLAESYWLTLESDDGLRSAGDDDGGRVQ